MQAAGHENNTIPDKNASHEIKTTVRLSKDHIHLKSNVWPARPKLIGVKKKLDRREAVRERKALSAAHLEKSIEKELIERLKSKAYGDAPLNVNESVWQAILDREKKSEKNKLKEDGELELEDDETDEEELEEDEDDWGEREFVSDMSEDEDGLSDLEDAMVSIYRFNGRLILYMISRVRVKISKMVQKKKTMKLWRKIVREMVLLILRYHSVSEKLLPQHPSHHASDPRIC